MENLRKISSYFFQKFRQKTFTVILLFTVALSQQSLGQLSDNFSDGDFSASPAWTGDDSKFVIDQDQLRLQAPSVSGSAYLSTVSNAFYNATWEFFLKMEFNPSSGNYVKVYLAADQADLSGPLNGYFVLIGDTPDEVSLYKQTGNIKTKIIDGADDRVNLSTVDIKIKVTRDALGNWQLFSDAGVTGTYATEGAVNDVTHLSSGFFGIHCIYTSTRSDKFYFDDFTVAGESFIDLVPPETKNVAVTSPNEIEIGFSEPVTKTSAEDIQHFFVSGGLGNPSMATLQPDESTVGLVFSQSFPNGIERTLSVEGISDLNGNTLDSSSYGFLFFQPVPATAKDIIITEIFPDPSPTFGLPEVEFVELYNRSENPFDLAGWTLTDGSSTGNLSSFILLPGEYLILSSTSAQAQLNSYGKAMGLSPFPSLNNSGDFLVLKDPGETTIDSVAYSSAWYKDEDKEDGGWSLELIDPEDFCKGPENWKVSQHESGGTPGMQNSVYAHQPDLTGPELLSASRSDHAVLLLNFNEALDKVPPPPGSFIIEPTVEIIGVSFAGESYSTILLLLSQDLDSTKTYSIKAQNIYDCPGNEIQDAFSEVSLKLDTIPAEIQSLKVISQDQLELSFSEKMDKTSAENILNYKVAGAGNPASAILQADQRTVTLLFDKSFVNGMEGTLQVDNLFDLAQNPVDSRELPFMFFSPVEARYKDIIITEIMADPSPAISLPEAEFIELYNRSNDPFDLQGWKFSASGSTVKMGSSILLPHAYLILCNQPKATSFYPLAKTMGLTGFPLLNNKGEPLVLKDTNGSLIDSVNYADKWYKDDEKKDGGWSLELIDPENVCSESENWIASEDTTGGTPGKQNSVFADKPDLTGPKLLSAFPVSSTELLLQFNEKLDKKLPQAGNFELEPELEFGKVEFADASLTSFYLTLDEELHGGTAYRLHAENIYDCAGNILQTDFSNVSFALPEPAAFSDLLINEILFNPSATGVDFVEICNQSAKFINLKNWKLANFENDTAVSLKIISEKDFLLAPHAYIVFTEDGNVLKGEYLQSKEETFFEMGLPSFPDEAGSVALLNDKDEVMDSFLYSDSYHSVFMKNVEGVSLERISFDKPANDPQNWRSASADSGFATPGYLNSNSRDEGIADESVVIDPEIFIPLYSQPDFAQIRYSFAHGGYVANVKIFDPQGREIKQIADNEILGADGFFIWEGDRDDGSRARIGSYMVWFEIFDAGGVVKIFRKRVVVAGKF